MSEELAKRAVDDWAQSARLLHRIAGLFAHRSKRRGEHKPGCCVDESCDNLTCMTLADGLTCGYCRHFSKCRQLFAAKTKNTTCDFYPRRFDLDTRPGIPSR